MLQTPNGHYTAHTATATISALLFGKNNFKYFSH